MLVKCCEEIQPHEWKAPVEREEHRLPFWLKVFPAALHPGLEGELLFSSFLVGFHLGFVWISLVGFFLEAQRLCL